MTKEMIQAQYKEVAAKAGDLYFRMERARAVMADLQKQMAELTEQRNELERKSREVKEDVAVSEPKAE